MDFFDISYMQINIWQEYIEKLRKELINIKEDEDRISLIVRISRLERLILSEKQAILEEKNSEIIFKRRSK